MHQPDASHDVPYNISQSFLLCTLCFPLFHGARHQTCTMLLLQLPICGTTQCVFGAPPNVFVVVAQHPFDFVSSCVIVRSSSILCVHTKAFTMASNVFVEVLISRITLLSESLSILHPCELDLITHQQRLLRMCLFSSQSLFLCQMTTQSI